MSTIYDLTAFFNSFWDFLYDLYLDVLSKPVFNMYGQTVRLGWVFIAFIVLAMACSAFWRGARG